MAKSDYLIRKSIVIIFCILLFLAAGKRVHASASRVSELERMQVFSDYVQEQGLTDSVVGFGDFDIDDDGMTFVDTGVMDQRMQGMAAQIAAMDNEYGPYVPDVVTHISSDKKTSQSGLSEEQRLSSFSALAGEVEPFSTEEVISDNDMETAANDINQSDTDDIILAAENRVLGYGQSFFSRESLSGIRREISGTVSGASFPTTDWRRFGKGLESLGTFTLTAYDPCLLCCGKTDGITATGTKGMAGRTVAVDPSVIPYGSRLLIGGYVFIAEDTGSAIKGKHIDMFMDTHEVAMMFGKRDGEVFLIR